MTEDVSAPVPVGSPVDGLGGQQKPVCNHPRKVETHFTYGYRMHCPDCKHSEESWWD